MRRPNEVVSIVQPEFVARREAYFPICLHRRIDMLQFVVHQLNGRLAAALRIAGMPSTMFGKSGIRTFALQQDIAHAARCGVLLSTGKLPIEWLDAAATDPNGRRHCITAFRGIPLRLAQSSKLVVTALLEVRTLLIAAAQTGTLEVLRYVQELIGSTETYVDGHRAGGVATTDLVGSGFAPSSGLRSQRSLLTACIKGVHAHDDSCAWLEGPMSRLKRNDLCNQWYNDVARVENITLKLVTVALKTSIIDTNGCEVTSGFLVALAKWAGADAWSPTQTVDCLLITPGLVDIFRLVHDAVLVQLNEILQLYTGSMKPSCSRRRGRDPGDVLAKTISWSEMQFFVKMSATRHETSWEKWPEKTPVGGLLKELSVAAEKWDLEHPDSWRMDGPLEIDERAAVVVSHLVKDNGARVTESGGVVSTAVVQHARWLRANQFYWCP